MDENDSRGVSSSTSAGVAFIVLVSAAALLFPQAIAALVSEVELLLPLAIAVPFPIPWPLYSLVVNLAAAAICLRGRAAYWILAGVAPTMLFVVLTVIPFQLPGSVTTAVALANLLATGAAAAVALLRAPRQAVWYVVSVAAFAVLAVWGYLEMAAYFGEVGGVPSAIVAVFEGLGLLVRAALFAALGHYHVGGLSIRAPRGHLSNTGFQADGAPPTAD